MADVTRVRLTGRPRPLGVLKDEVMYFEITNRYRAFKRKERLPHDFYRRGRQLTHEMKGGLHQAALINIVAAVNDRYVGEPVRKPEYVHAPQVDPMTVLSTLVSQRDRTISIPRPQMFMHFPHKLIQRKPVYYKHSEEEVKRDNAFLFNRSATSFQLKSRVREKPSSGSSEPLIKISSVTTSKDGVQGEKTVIIRDPFTDSSTNKPKISGVKHGAQPRHSESRKYREISKCDAIDIMDATDAMKREHTMSPKSSQGVNSDSNNQSPNPFPFYRTKSLPSIFSPRRNKSGSAKHRQRTPASSSGQQQLPSPRQIVHSGNEIPHGVYGRPVITSREAANNEDTRRPISRSSRDMNSAGVSPNLSPFVDRDNRPTTSPVLERVQLVGIASRSSKSDDRTRANDLQRRISTENGGETTSEVSFNESRFVVSAKSQKSIIVNRQQGNTEGASEKRTSFKRVKFASVDDVDNRSDDQLDTTSVDNTHNEILANQYHVQGHKYKIGSSDPHSENNYFQSSSGEPRPGSEGPRSQSRQSGVSTLSNNGSLKPMTLNELDRLKQKFIPNDLRSSLSSQASFYLYDDIKISKLKTKEITPTKKENDIKTEEEEEKEDRNDIGTKTNSESKLLETNEANETRKENDFRNEEEEIREEEKDDETNVYSGEDQGGCNAIFIEKQTDKKEESVYQLMRAFENDPYSDFEHKKIRRKHQNYDKSENKAQYLKVKLDN
ncbi:hypothetical protein CHS0354_025788 [Potamilus streckersoni]|uniref:Uncharacterized protein n=1 Tax=Potamilus streckersoni TaxID=2493646 RepID=A0AAE0TCS9_9BIVA|nr:hypothetical protein CHS0354_025788 [Potamilus streckersoni]